MGFAKTAVGGVGAIAVVLFAAILLVLAAISALLLLV
jgi:hypothetical protein